MSALFRRYRNGELNNKDITTAIKELDNDVYTFNVETMSCTIVTEAENLLKIYGKTYGLRTLDALHLAAFSLISESDWTFVTADIQQNEVAKEMNITTILPIR